MNTYLTPRRHRAGLAEMFHQIQRDIISNRMALIKAPHAQKMEILNKKTAMRFFHFENLECPHWLIKNFHG